MVSSERQAASPSSRSFSRDALAELPIAELPDFSNELDKEQPGWRDKYQAWRKGAAKGAKGEGPSESSPKQTGLAAPLLKRLWSEGDQVDNFDAHAFLMYTAKYLMSKTSGQTNFEAIVNLLNNCLGVGILGVPYAISQTGLLAGLFIMVCSALVNAYTLILHQKACKIIGVPSGGAELAQKTLGEPGNLLMVVLLTGFGFFCMVAMVSGSTDACIEILKMGFDSTALPSDVTIMKLCWVFLLVPPTLIRSMKNVATLSFIAFVACLLLVCSILVTCGSRMATNGLPAVDDIKWLPDDFHSFMVGFPTLLLVFSIQACGAVVLATMENTETSNLVKVTAQSYAIVFLLDVSVGVSVYLTFLTNTEKDLIKDMSLPPPFNLAADLGILAVFSQLVLLALSYMLMIIPCKIAILQLVFGKQEAKMESTPAEFYGTTLIINFMALVTGLAVSDLSILFGINGAVFTNLLAFILPPLMFVKARASPEVPEAERVAMTSPANLPYWAILLCGLIMLTICSYKVSQQLMEKIAA